MKLTKITQNISTQIICVQCKKNEVYAVLNEFFTRLYQNHTHIIQLQKNFLPEQNSEAQVTLIYFLLSDLQILQYNDFLRQIQGSFRTYFQENSQKIQMYLVPVENQQESMKYINKLRKFQKEDFETSLKALNQDSIQKYQRNLIKNFLLQNFKWTKEEVFEWLKMNEISTLTEFLSYKRYPSYQKRYVAALLQKLVLLENYEKKLSKNEKIK